MLKFDLTLFNDNTEGERYSDMSAVDIKVGVVLGQIRVVFVNKFVTDMLVRAIDVVETKTVWIVEIVVVIIHCSNQQAFL